MVCVVMRTLSARRAGLMGMCTVALLSPFGTGTSGAIQWNSIDTPLSQTVGGPPAFAVTTSGEAIIAMAEPTGMAVHVQPSGGTAATQHISGGDPLTGKLATDGSGGAYLAWTDAQGAKVAHRPQGGTFGAPTLVVPSAAAVVFAVAASGDAELAGFVPSNLGSQGFTAMAAHRSSGTWTSPVAASDPGAASASGPSPVIAIAANGAAVALWGASGGMTVTPFSATGTPGTPQTAVLEATNLPTPDLAMAPDGRAILAGKSLNALAGIGYRTAPAGGPFGEFHTLTAPGQNALEVHVAAGPDGRAALTLDVNEPDGNGQVAKDVEATVGSLASPLPALTAVSSGPGAHPRVVFDSAGRALVTYNDLSGPEVFADGQLWSAMAAPQEMFGAPLPVTCAPPFAIPLAAGAGLGNFFVLSVPGKEKPGANALSLATGVTSFDGQGICPPMLYGVFGPDLVTSANRGASFDASSMRFGPDDHVTFTWKVYELPQGTAVPSDGYAPTVPDNSRRGFAFPHPGRYRVAVTAWHDNAAKWHDQRSRDVLVDPAPTVTVTTSPSGTAAVGAPVTVTVTATPTAPATISSTSIIVPPGGVVTDEGPGRKTVVFSKVGSYQFFANATDSYGATGFGSVTVAVLVPSPTMVAGPRLPCATVAIPKSAKIDRRRGVLTLRAKPTSAGCRVEIVVLRVPAGGRAAAKSVRLGAVGTKSTIRVRLSKKAMAWLKKARRGKLVVIVTSPSGASSGRVSVRL